MFRRLLILNGLAALCVVLYHTSSWGFIAMFWWTHRYLPVTVPNFDQLGGVTYYVLRIIEQLVIFGVPAFLFISGFFVAVAAGRSRSAVEWKLVGTRIRNLVIPYLFWSILILLGESLQSRMYSVATYARRLALGRATSAFYFVPLLIQLYALSPVLVRIARRRWKLLLVAAGVVQIIAQSSQYAETLGVEHAVVDQLVALTPAWFFPAHIFWFVFGLVAGLNLQHLKQWLNRVKWALLAALLILILVGVIEFELLLRFSGEDWIGNRETIVDSLYAGSFILCFLAFDEAPIPLSKALERIGGKSFGVYLVHSSVLEVTARVVYHVAPWILASQLLFQPLLFALGLGIPLALMVLVNRSPAQRCYRYIFG